MKSQHGNNEIKNHTAKKNHLFNLERSKLIIPSKGELGHHCVQTDVQPQSSEQICHGTVQRVGVIKNTESSVWAVQKQKYSMVG